jgi:hypothetical protein
MQNKEGEFDSGDPQELAQDYHRLTCYFRGNLVEP